MMGRPTSLLVLTLMMAPGMVEAQAPAPRSRPASPPPAAVPSPAGPKPAVAMDTATCGDAMAALDARLRGGALDAGARRDRATCHDKLGHPFPAIEDYREYLVLQPDATDSERIRARLLELEQQAGLVGGEVAPESSTAPDPDDSASASAHINDDGVSGSASLRAGSGDGDAPSGATFDERMARERDRLDAGESPLRAGTGFSLAPYASLRRFVGSGASSDLGFGFGVSPRYSLGRHIGLLGELGLVSYGASGSATQRSGIGLLAALEARAFLSRDANNQLVFVAGPGFERFSSSSLGLVVHAYMLRGRVAFRHVFSSRVALELGVDPGVAILKPTKVPSGASTASSTQGLVGATLALAIGF